MDRRLWSEQEDEHIKRLVIKYGTKKWPLISQKLCAQTQFERTGKQCRQRWYNHLDPQINSSHWSEQDEQQLFEAHKKYGNKWKYISKLLVGRTDNSIKNHFYSTIRRCLRRINKLQGQKNSTIKMRTLKPYVLSKILADINLTETILELGKIKPNKKNRELNPDYFVSFNEMIQKLYAINRQYEELKIMKKGKGGLSIKMDREEHLQHKDSNYENKSNRQMECQEEESSRKKSPSKIQKIVLQLKSDKKIQQNTTQPLTIKKPKKIKRLSQKVKFNIIEQIKEKQTPNPIHISHIYPSSNLNKRPRKYINYMKLNQGILCENYRAEFIDQTNHESKASQKKLECFSSLEHLSFEHLQNEEKLQQIEEQQQKSHEKDNHFQNSNIFSPDFADSRLIHNFNIANPSPSYVKSRGFLDDLVVIGTQLKIFPTPHPQNSAQKPNQYETRELFEHQRKQSQEQFIEQILQIDFDPEFAFKEEPQGQDS